MQKQLDDRRERGVCCETKDKSKKRLERETKRVVGYFWLPSSSVSFKSVKTRTNKQTYVFFFRSNSRDSFSDVRTYDDDDGEEDELEVRSETGSWSVESTMSEL